ncbi:hypothetical protein, partial [Nocardia sp. NPDC058497]|uniref:hypothetical protein n=1 Tax=Nocardia sp. NPDC058497 TaxID=3346529 RepID=UPI00365DB9E2
MFVRDSTIVHEATIFQTSPPFGVKVGLVLLTAVVTVVLTVTVSLKFIDTNEPQRPDLVVPSAQVSGSSPLTVVSSTAVEGKSTDPIVMPQRLDLSSEELAELNSLTRNSDKFRVWLEDHGAVALNIGTT